MEGAVLKAERELDLMIAQAWHVAKFNAAQKAGKLRGLSSYVGKRAKGGKSTASQALSFFTQMKARGLPVKIYRTPAKDRTKR